MRKFNINVNGKSYAVEVEEITDGATVSAPVQAAAPVAKAAPVAAAPVGNGKPVKSQMPGLVKKLCFANGATVKEGEAIIILEAMKMDTPISAPFSGVITYSTQEGANVDSGAVLCTIA
ncbi:MAG: acetyl-CoA carboxylase biotin carboxyl carrier protein subunit [Clostridia bacterium]|nr:acetyl-CoA carboxylase biotin carboxyl carrier protein subunit [Clostridia bacterium]